MREFHTIVEFSCNSKKEVITVRFLDGTCLRVPIEHLPPKFQIKAAEWDLAELGKDKTSLVVPAGKKNIEIPAFALYSAGRIL